MGHSSAVGFLALALCLVACVCESAASSSSGEEQVTEISLDDAKKTVVEANKSITEVLDKAQRDLDSTKAVLRRVESSKTESEQEESQADKAPKDNSKVQEIVQRLKNIVNTISTPFPDAKGRLQRAISSIEEVHKEAESLKTECDKYVVAIDALKGGYADIKNKASTLKDKADKLNTNITDTLNLISGIDVTAGQMKENAIKAQLANIHINGIVAVAKIQTIMEGADGIITKTNNEKKEVNDVVEEMKKHCTTDLIQAYEVVKEQCTSATDTLNSAKGAAAKAKNAMAAMKQQKGVADTALEKVQKPETAVSEAEEEVRKAEKCAATVQQSFLQLQSALQTAKNFVTKAKDSQQKLMAALSTTTTKLSTEQITATENADPPVGDGTELGQKDRTIQPTSKELPDQSDNSTDKLKDALIKGAQNVPTTALTGGKAPAPGAKNDSAMTVSVPLLVALIASAVLQ